VAPAERRMAHGEGNVLAFYRGAAGAVDRNALLSGSRPRWIASPPVAAAWSFRLRLQ
jgi:hypothetical protein